MEDELNEPMLNDMAWDLVQQAVFAADEFRIEIPDPNSYATILDFGVEAEGSLGAGIALAEITLAGQAEVSLTPGSLGEVGWPHVFVTTDSPVEACLLSQYAGWQLTGDDFFGMGSGPMRAAAGAEDLFKALEYREDATHVVGVIESGDFPTEDVVETIAGKCGVEPGNIALLVAPTASLAGSFQVVSRSVETAMHKLLELGFDVTRVESGMGWAPLAPVAADDLQGIGRTNDAILYGGRVTLVVSGDDESIEEIGPRIPSSGSPASGEPFLKIFEAAGRDFYKIDPMLFSPAEVILQNVETGQVHRFGRIEPDVVLTSFGL
ncbi:Methenyltetrahydromethanopterin cyclohydrolase [Maioricimonas rarisocia]|uniref:Methenyltetrahydromethanopterin cyclohydrolase n=1 Tax=Maioricimonas rarisocia TaxID=2528026 RepID=A0A517Z830_9PLAN|nr:methenyltetrahydromethanopterin cyclohydrolase [Maioricimonas rarisocia]QDU38650.1 Methenyltetrahydromethanopterin cyclohydrolase [Maioricimonas rarisocia]